MPEQGAGRAQSTTRMFVALVPPDDVTEYLASRVDAAGREMPGLRWTARRNWHVTLAFLAAVPDALVPAGIAELAEAVRGTDPFVLRLAGAGGFPRVTRASVVWAGTEGASAGDERALAQLAKHVRIGLRRARLRPDRTPFRPHVTVARVRPAADVTDVVERLAPEGDAGTNPLWAVRELELVASRLGAGPDGSSSYSTVATLGLGR